jgi:hypothetical protein
VQYLDYPTVRRKQLMLPSPYPRYYHWSADTGGDVMFAPPLSRAVSTANVKFRYVTSIDPSDVDDSDDIWDGLFREWHYIVPLRAGQNSYQSLELYERASYFSQQYLRELQGFAAVLGKTSVAKLMVQRDMRVDTGSVNG